VTTFRALSTVVRVAIDEDVELRDLANAIIAPYAPASDAELVYHVRRDRVLRDGVALSIDDPIDVVPHFEMDLYEQLVARAEPGWVLHAAAIDVGGRALVLCGPSGAGKTTLALALTARGHRLLTEEVVWVDHTGLVRGLPRPIHVPADSSQRSRIPASWRTLPYPIRERDGGSRVNTLVVPPSEVMQLDALPLRALVHIGHGADWPVRLEANPPGLGLQRVWDRALRQDDVGLAAATEVLRRYASYQLTSRTEEQALQLLEPLLSQP
jgi:hypothetical protein